MCPLPRRARPRATTSASCVICCVSFSSMFAIVRYATHSKQDRNYFQQFFLHFRAKRDALKRGDKQIPKKKGRRWQKNSIKIVIVCSLGILWREFPYAALASTIGHACESWRMSLFCELFLLRREKREYGTGHTHI